ncbi:MAG: deoxyribose-phosphate aldolase [Bacteroidales bacterium]|jgi:deoxyribose-phosphate aldolase|nr:deoxyribose-phosphate aldolase [Bacteroidales bacterium]
MNDLVERLDACINSYQGIDDATMNTKTAEIVAKAGKEASDDIYKLILSCLDLTTLSVLDTVEKVEGMVNKVNQFQTHFPDYPNVGAICVYPALVATVRENLQVNGVDIASVAGGFPAAQTFIEIKVAETSLAVMDGADEIDMVLGVGEFLSGNLEKCFEDISEIKAACGTAKLKVILETGALKTAENIYHASIIAMEAGADFIKTSTGKEIAAASPEAAYVMTKAIREFTTKSGRKVGFKAAGGIATTEEVLKYYTIVKENLGEEWLNNNHFRIGASRLANNLLMSLGYTGETYF